MLPIPAGEFRMGTSSEDEARLVEQESKLWDDEKPDHTIELSVYSIGKYPVTNLEFRAFYEQHGYDNADYWSPEGWLWRMGKWEFRSFYIH